MNRTEWTRLFCKSELSHLLNVYDSLKCNTFEYEKSLVDFIYIPSIVDVICLKKLEQLKEYKWLIALLNKEVDTVNLFGEEHKCDSLKENGWLGKDIIFKVSQKDINKFAPNKKKSRTISIPSMFCSDNTFLGDSLEWTTTCTSANANGDTFTFTKEYFQKLQEKVINATALPKAVFEHEVMGTWQQFGESAEQAGKAVGKAATHIGVDFGKGVSQMAQAMITSAGLFSSFSESEPISTRELTEEEILERRFIF